MSTNLLIVAQDLFDKDAIFSTFLPDINFPRIQYTVGRETENSNSGISIDTEDSIFISDLNHCMGSLGKREKSDFTTGTFTFPPKTPFFCFKSLKQLSRSRSSLCSPARYHSQLYLERSINTCRRSNSNWHWRIHSQGNAEGFVLFFEGRTRSCPKAGL